MSDVPEIDIDTLEQRIADGVMVIDVREDDEYVGLVRVDAGDLDEPRVFLSDRRAVLTGDAAALIWEDVDPVVEDEDDADDDGDDEGIRPVAEPVGDAALLTDLGTSSDVLLEACAEEGVLPADVLTGIAERAGFLDVLDGLRDG